MTPSLQNLFSNKLIKKQGGRDETKIHKLLKRFTAHMVCCNWQKHATVSLLIGLQGKRNGGVQICGSLSLQVSNFWFIWLKTKKEKVKSFQTLYIAYW